VQQVWGKMVEYGLGLPGTTALWNLLRIGFDAMKVFTTFIFVAKK